MDHNTLHLNYVLVVFVVAVVVVVVVVAYQSIINSEMISLGE